MKSYKANYTAILIAETLAMIGFSLSIPIIPLFLEDDIGITDPVMLKIWVGVIQSSAGLTMAIFAPIWGHLADIYSRKAMLLRAMFGGAIFISLMTFVNSPWQLLVLKTIQGCVTGTVAAATVLIASITPAAQVALALGLLQTMIAVGSSVGPLIGGLLSDFLGHRAAFFATGLSLALAGFIVLKWVENDKQPSREKGTGKLSLIPNFRPIINSPLLITMMLVTFGVHSANSAASPMIPLFLKSLLKNISEAPSYIASSAGIVLGVGAASTAIAAVLVGKFSSSIGYWRTLVLCLSAGAIMTIPQIFVTNMIQLTVLRAISAFFIGGAIPVINAIIAVSTDKKIQGTVFGFNSSVTAAGAALGPLIGSAAAMINYRMVFLVAAVILGLSALETSRRRKRIIIENN